MLSVAKLYRFFAALRMTFTDIKYAGRRRKKKQIIRTDKNDDKRHFD